MKFLSILIISFFVMSTVEIPFALLQETQARSCCCKAGTVCRCQSKGVSMCPMKRMKEAEAEAGHGHCALQRAKALKKAVKKAVKKAEDSGAPLFKAFGCGSSEEHKAAPTYSRDFTFDLQLYRFGGLEPQFFVNGFSRNELPQIFYPIERPPQISLFSI